MRAAVHVIHPPALNCCMLSLPSFILSLIHISANKQELTMRWEALTHDLPFVHLCGSVCEREKACVCVWEWEGSHQGQLQVNAGSNGGRSSFYAGQ